MTSSTTSQPAPASAPAAPSSSGSVPTYVPPSNLLQRGSSGKRVAHVQRLLGIRHDGRFGPRTRHAVVRFQHQHHLVVDGVVGPKTRAALRRYQHHLHAHPFAFLHPILWATLEHALSDDGSV
jgi:peptidoglycan hydrolase-like protein with peptidoglycan-binding domain